MFAGPDEDYGALELGCAIIDMPLDEYENKKKLFLQKIMLSAEEIVAIERDTVGQQENDQWQIQRQSRLTASNFGKVCKLRQTTLHANTLYCTIFFMGIQQLGKFILTVYITKFMNCLFYFITHIIKMNNVPMSYIEIWY